MKVQKSAVALWVLVLLGMVIVGGCGVKVDTPVPTPDIAATVQAAVAIAMTTQAAQAEPTVTPTPVLPTATPEPINTPTVGLTVTPTPVPPSPPPTPTATPTFTSTPTDTPTPSPPPTPTPIYCPDLSNVTILTPEGTEGSMEPDANEAARRQEQNSPHRYTSPVRVTWAEACRRRMVVQVYHYGRPTPIFPPNDPHQESPWGVEISLDPSSEPYEIKVWIPGTMIYDSVWITVMD